MEVLGVRASDLVWKRDGVPVQIFYGFTTEAEVSIFKFIFIFLVLIYLRVFIFKINYRDSLSVDSITSSATDELRSTIHWTLF